jgi:hypothetical protein
MDHVAHRKLGDLAGFGAGMSAMCTILAGTWRGDTPVRIFWRSTTSALRRAPPTTTRHSLGGAVLL